MTSNDTDILLVDDNQDDVDLTLHALRSEHLANLVFVARDDEEVLAVQCGRQRDRRCSRVRGEICLWCFSVCTFESGHFPQLRNGRELLSQQAGQPDGFFSMMRSIEEFWFGSVSLPPQGE